MSGVEVREQVRPALSETTRELLDTLKTGPALITVCGPAGHGKSTLLTSLAKGLADREVWGPAEVAGGVDPGWPTVVVLDDADQLAPEVIARVRELVAANLVGAVLASRLPLPDFVPTRAVTLAPFDVAEVEASLADGDVPPEHAERVHAFTGGVPRYVDWVVAAYAGDLADAERRAAERLRLDGEPVLEPLPEIALRALPLDMLLRLGEERLRAARPVHDLAETLAESGATGPVAADVLVSGARELVVDRPNRASALFAAAVRAGAPVGNVEGEWARAAALAGEFETALRLSDAMLVGDSLGTRLAGAAVAAAVSAHNAELARSAVVSAWAGRGPARHYGAIALIGTGWPDHARELLDSPEPEAAPTSTAGMSARMADGIAQSVAAPAAHALSTLLGAAALESDQAHIAPDSPAALAAIVAIHAGEPDLAQAVLNRARDEHTMMANRHRILLAWLAMVRGDLRGATVTPRGRLFLRDELFLSGLAVGLARRGSDLAALREQWRRAYQVVMRVQPDLFSLLPLGELVVGAARLGESARLATHVDQAEQLLARLGNPPLWSVPFAWNRFQAAIIAKDDELAHLRELERHADASTHSATMYQAALSWQAVLTGVFDAEPVIAAADELLACGLRWEASSLAAQAALRTPDRGAMITLLETARRLQGSRRAVDPGPLRTIEVLSEREREVARLVPQGLTYKQIGELLFISGKTVEHHVAKIRSKLGASSRQELLRVLRELLDEGR